MLNARVIFLGKLFCINNRVGDFVRIVVLFIILSFTHIDVYAASVIDEAKQIIESNSINSISDNPSNSSVEDMVKSLDDPYAQYISPQEYRSYMDNLNDKYVGIGAYISAVPEGVKIVSFMDGSSAAEAGLKEGDIITIADGHILSGLPLGIASAYIKGEEGSVANLQIKRDTNFFTCDVVRKKIAIPTVDASILDRHIGYIKISSFTESTYNDFIKKLRQLKSENPDNYIIDLRDNGGGLLSSAIDVSGCFIEALKPVVLVKDRNESQVEHISFGSSEFIDKPVIFLVNKNTASAAEILTAAVKDYNKALILGTNTYGKGTVQGIFKLSDGSAIKMTMQTFYSPLGTPIEKIGVQPHIDLGEVDALAAAMLLFGKGSSGEDKSGFAKYIIGSREFEIDLNEAKSEKGWKAFNKIIENVISRENKLFIGMQEGWVEANECMLKDIFKIYYPGYIVIGELNNVATDKVFTVTFTKNVNGDSINKDNIELINTKTGERILLSFEAIDGRRVKAIPETTLSIGHTYYFIIHTAVMGINGESLNQGAVTKVTVGRY